MAGLPERVQEAEDRGFLAGAEVDRAFYVGAGGGEDGVDQVVDVDEVAGLLAVAEYGRVLAGEQEFAEDRARAGLALRALAGAVDIAEAE